MWTTPDGYILRLPRSGLTKIISRLPDSGLRDLLGSDLNGNLRREVVNSIGQLARAAHHTGDAYHAKSRKKYPMFTARLGGGNFVILTRPLAIKQSAIVFVHPAPEAAAEKPRTNGSAKRIILSKDDYHPNVLESDKALRRAANGIFFKANPHLKSKVQVGHRLPLEWRRLFPKMNPNRLSNLIGLATAEHVRKATGSWNAFRRMFRHLKRNPTPKEVVQHMHAVDRLILLR